MDLDAARAFLRDHHRAVLATTRADGAPQMSPVAVAVDDEGHAVVSTRETAAKTRNLRRTPHAWLCVLSDQWYGQWIQIEGDVEIVSLPDAMEGLVAYYRAAAGEHPDWDDYRAAMRREQRVLLRITLTRAGPDQSG
jgi:PPOX class probable F420-dependent enzyme